jgi:hypothetical protein
MSRANFKAFTVVDIPKPDGLVSTATNEGLTIRTEGN